MGRLCRSCGKQCRDDTESISIECPSCFGHGCDHCNDGQWDLRGCPNAYCRDLSTAIRLADLFEKGLPPVSGGSLEQSVTFVEFVQRLAYEEQLIKAERNAND